MQYQKILLDNFCEIRYDERIFERQRRCTVAFRFLSERGSHRLKASLSSNEMSNFPPELFVPNSVVLLIRELGFRYDMNRRVVRNVMRVKQMRVRAFLLGKLGGTAEFISSLVWKHAGDFSFCVQAMSVQAK